MANQIQEEVDRILRIAVEEGTADSIEELYAAYVRPVGLATALERFRAVRTGLDRTVAVGLPVGLVDAILSNRQSVHFTSTHGTTK